MTNVFQVLEKRSRELGMTYRVLAQRCGVSQPTVVRILSGKQPNAAWQNVLAVAQTLGMTINVAPSAAAEDLLLEQAEKKATELVGIVQGTAALEGQAVDGKFLKRLRRQTVHELLVSSKRRLWDA
jgi:transcriptional regulator with XRE-family HTH domain